MALWLFFREDMTNSNYYNSTTPMPMVTKLGRLVTYLEWLLPIKSYEHIIAWSSGITWPTKIIMYPLPQCLWLPNLAGWRYKTRSFLLLRHKALGSHCLTRSYEILHLLYLCYLKVLVYDIGLWSKDYIVLVSSISYKTVVKEKRHIHVCNYDKISN